MPPLATFPPPPNMQFSRLPDTAPLLGAEDAFKSADLASAGLATLMRNWLFGYEGDHDEDVEAEDLLSELARIAAHPVFSEQGQVFLTRIRNYLDREDEGQEDLFLFSTRPGLLHAVSADVVDPRYPSLSQYWLARDASKTPEWYAFDSYRARWELLDTFAGQPHWTAFKEWAARNDEELRKLWGWPPLGEAPAEFEGPPEPSQNQGEDNGQASTPGRLWLIGPVSGTYYRADIGDAVYSYTEGAYFHTDNLEYRVTFRPPGVNTQETLADDATVARLIDNSSAAAPRDRGSARPRASVSRETHSSGCRMGSDCRICRSAMDGRVWAEDGFDGPAWYVPRL